MAPGRRLIVRGTTTAGEEHAEAAVVEEVAAVAGRLADRARGRPRGRRTSASTVVVHGNVALATHGETVQQLLGSGPRERAVPALHARARAADVRPVDRRPVRRRAPRSRCGSTTCAGTRCRRSSAPGRATARTRCARTRTGKAYVQFGDGERGARLPTGSNNVRAHLPQGHRRRRQRQGRRARAAARPAARRQGRRATRRPRAAASTPSRRTSARASIPLGVRTLGRAVSLLDYEDFARAFAGVAKAHAAVLPLRGRPDDRRHGRASRAATGSTTSPTRCATHGDPRVAGASCSPATHGRRSGSR